MNIVRANGNIMQIFVESYPDRDLLSIQWTSSGNTAWTTSQAPVLGHLRHRPMSFSLSPGTSLFSERKPSCASASRRPLSDPLMMQANRSQRRHRLGQIRQPVAGGTPQPRVDQDILRGAGTADHRRQDHDIRRRDLHDTPTTPLPHH